MNSWVPVQQGHAGLWRLTWTTWYNLGCAAKGLLVHPTFEMGHDLSLNESV